MSEDENLLLKLKDNEALPWKVIASRFQEVGRGEFRVATLQMRHKRLKEKMRVWEPEEVCSPDINKFFCRVLTTIIRLHSLKRPRSRLRSKSGSWSRKR